MASTIAAVTTSGGGVVTTADASGDLNLLAGTTTVVAVTTAGAAVTGTLSATGLISGSLDQGTGFKNRIINGAMVIDQRNAGASVTPANGVATYVVDRWKYYVTQASKLTAQQNAGAVTPPAGFSNYLGTTSSSAYSVISSDLFTVYQAVEGLNVADFAWGTANASTITISLWVRSSLTGTHSGALQNSANNRSYGFTFTVNSANTWEQKSVTIAGDQSGTWLTTNGVGLSLYFNLGAGSTYSTTAGSWQAGNFTAVTGAVSVVGTNGATFYITGVQLEKGSTATSFDYRPYGTELALCQRYYEKTFNQSVAPVQNSGSYPGTISVASTGTSSLYNLATSWQWKVVKRTTPTITSFSVGAATSDWYAPAGPFTVAFNSGTAGDASVYIQANAAPPSFPNIYYVHMTAAAEL